MYWIIIIGLVVSLLPMMVISAHSENKPLDRRTKSLPSATAFNPLEWFPWGEEAFTKAKSEDKPIFLSIGYSTCHWCHVMAHESFENREEQGFSMLEQSYDPQESGFGQAPKFPRPVVFSFLFSHYLATGEEKARDMALFTLQKMAAGGMYDQIGGGFHRYSVNANWFVPHFEKMLYDQA